MKNLISQQGIAAKELCRRMGKYKLEIDANTKNMFWEYMKKIRADGVPAKDDPKVESILTNFSEVLCMTLGGKDPGKAVNLTVSYIINDNIPIHYVETFIFDFRDMVTQYVQREFSNQYYGFFSAQKLIDSALRKIWTQAISEYYRQMTKSLAESEKKYETLYQSSGDAIMTLAPPTWRFTSGNAATVRMFRTKDENDFTRMGPWELSPKYQPDGQFSAVKAKKMIMKAMKEGSNFFEWTHKRKGGEEFPADVLLTRIKTGDETYLQATVRDLTEKKRAEEMLKESEEKYKVIFDNANDEIIYADKYGKIVDLNLKVKDVLGFDREEMIGKNFAKMGFFKLGNLPKMLKILEEMVIGGKQMEKIEFTAQRKDGREVILEANAKILKKDGKMEGIIAIVRDITEQKRMENALKESEEKYKVIFEIGRAHV